MRTDVDVSRTSHVLPGLLAQIGDTIHVWRARQMQRRELTRWTERDVHDVGPGWSEVIQEAKGRSGGRKRPGRRWRCERMMPRAHPG